MRRIANAHRSYAHPLAWWFPDDGRELLFTAGHEGDGELRCWDTVSGLRVVDFEADEWLLVHNGALAPLPDGRLILATSDPDGLHRWDAHTGQSLGRNESTTIWHVTKVAGAPRVIVASEDETVHQWNALTGEELAPPHPGGAAAAALRPDGTAVLATGSHDGALRLDELGTD
ncbi:WD40 repeat domain-containing protein [Streptomyces sp. NPDC001890]|uniref:WD40 repeat domain-containing protein n=1 Tax=Streptomyces sp. NPDC001890 TaxID=3364620 RepID=UPI0036CB8177